MKDKLIDMIVNADYDELIRIAEAIIFVENRESEVPHELLRQTSA